MKNNQLAEVKILAYQSGLAEVVVQSSADNFMMIENIILNISNIDTYTNVVKYF